MNASTNFNIREIFQDIQRLQLEDHDTVADLKANFYTIVRKYGLKRGTKLENGATAMNNPEWQAVESLFLAHIQNELVLTFLFEETPEDIFN